MKIKAVLIINVLLMVLIASCQSDDQLEFTRYYTTGRLVYQSHCQNCHGQHGEGLGQLIPSLTDSIYLKANKNTLVCTVQYGLKGKIIVANKSFDGNMPANNLTGIELAEVLTYITNSFGNKLGTVNVAQVNGALANCK